MVVAQRFHAQKSGLRKVADRQRGGHNASLASPPRGESSGEEPIDLLPRVRPIMKVRAAKVRP